VTKTTTTEAKREEGSERTCVGCRATSDPEELERFVWVGDELIYDMRRRAPGRGAWVHVREECLRRALRGGFSRSFREGVKAPVFEELVEVLRAGLERRVVEALQVEIKSARLCMGADAVVEGLERKKVSAVWIASDIGANTRSRIEACARRAEVALIEAWDGERLGALFGRPSVVVIGIHDAKRASRVALDVKSLVNLAAFGG
jgi:predicted RNA-binding protein YlxR (DUF448 family)/ribosomal protein L30E